MPTAVSMHTLIHMSIQESASAAAFQQCMAPRPMPMDTADECGYIGSISASPTACPLRGHFEYRHAHTRAMGMSSAMPRQSRYRAGTVRGTRPHTHMMRQAQELADKLSSERATLSDFEGKWSRQLGELERKGAALETAHRRAAQLEEELKAALLMPQSP